jgi:hypothetical protein
LWRDLNAGVVSTIEGFVQPAEKEIRIRMSFGPGMSLWNLYWMFG